MREDRIAQLSQRFRTHAVGRRPETTRNRERRSFYLDVDLVARLDKAYRDMNYELYQTGGISKSLFLETVIEYGLEHAEELKANLTEKGGNGGGEDDAP